MTLNFVEDEGEEGFSLFGSNGGADEIIRRTTRKTTLVVGFTEDSEYGNIQEAINDLPNSGGEIFIKEGIYELDQAIVINKDNVVLRGNSWGAVLQTGTFATVISGTNQNNFVLENLKIVGKGSGANGIELINCDYCRIRNCWFSGCDEGMDVNDCEHVIIENNRIDSNSGGVGILLKPTTTFCVIKNNIIDANVGAAIQNDGADKCIIQENFIKNADIGIYFSTTCTKNLVINNYIDIDSTGQYGIHDELNNDENIYNGNYIEEEAAGKTGIFIEDATSSENMIINNNLRNCTTPITDAGTNTFTGNNNVA